MAQLAPQIRRLISEAVPMILEWEGVTSANVRFIHNESVRFQAMVMSQTLCSQEVWMSKFARELEFPMCVEHTLRPLYAHVERALAAYTETH